MNYTYYWYDAKVSKKYNPNYIKELIESHNWAEFKKIKDEYDKLDENEEMFHSFPNYVFDEENDVRFPLTEETFMQIEYSESENG